MRKDAAELLALAPNVMLIGATPTMAAVREMTRTVPVVFINVADPVGAGFVESLARPNGNVTGFALFDANMSGKWLELLKEITPPMRRVAVLYDPAAHTGVGQLATIQAAGPGFGVEVTAVNAREAGAIERSLAAFSGSSDCGLIGTGSPLVARHRDLILEITRRNSLPAIFPYRHFTSGGGLISYGPDLVEQYRRSADYIGRILNGQSPADLPVQFPTTYELAINLKTAKALGLVIPPNLLARANEVIE
jgi:putative ABC transport system substrate-binding protein